MPSFTLPNVASLLAYSLANLSDGTEALINNYSQKGDLGGGNFVWNSTSYAVPDSGITLCPTANLFSSGSQNLFTADGHTTAFTWSNTIALNYSPIIPQSVQIFANGQLIAKDNWQGQLSATGSTKVSGTVEYPGGNGHWTLNFTTAPAAGTVISATHQSANPGRWVRQYIGPVQDVFFGVMGNYYGWNTPNDDTAALQAAINYCAFNAENRGAAGSFWKALSLPPTSGSRYVTKSLNATLLATNPGQGNFSIIGNGCTIFGKLSAAYPILDLTGNNNAFIDDLGVFSAGGSESVAVLQAATLTNGQGGVNTTFRRLKTNLGLAIINSDLCMLDDCQITNNNGWALLAVTDNPTNLASAYQAVNGAEANMSILRIRGGLIQSYSTTTGVIWHTINGTLFIEGTYITPNGGNGSRPCTIRIGNSYASTKQLIGRLRVENQSQQSGLPVVQVCGSDPGQVIMLDIAGAFYLGGNDPCFDLQPANGSAQTLDIGGLSIGNSNGILTEGSFVTCMSGNAHFNCPLVTGNQQLAAKSGGINISGIPNQHAAAFLAANKSLINLKLTDNGANYWTQG